MSKDCFNECPQECNSVEFSLTTSQSDFPSPFYANLLIRNNNRVPNYRRNLTSFDYIKKTVMKVNIYYSDIAFTSIREIPAKAIEQLVGDLGGILGICLGASLLSFIELIEIVLQVTFIYAKLKKKQFSRSANNKIRAVGNLRERPKELSVQDLI